MMLTKFYLIDKCTVSSIFFHIHFFKNPTIAATVNTAGENGKSKGLQLQGEARKLEEEEIVGAAREYFAKRGTTKLPETLEDVNDLTKGRSWYVLKPTKIYILDEELFGYERKEYTPETL